MQTLAEQTADDEALVARLAEDLRHHAGFGEKYSGGPGDQATADWIAERMQAAGLRVDRHQIDTPYFTPRVCTLRCAGDSLDVLPQAPVMTTGSAGITAPLAIIHSTHDAARAANAIAIVVAPFRRHAAIWLPPIGPLVSAAVEAGAKAIVIVTTGPSGEAVALNAPLDAPFTPVPSAVLAPRALEPLLAAAARGEVATLILDGGAERRQTANLMATLDRGPRWLAFSTPRTGWFDCVGERGTGTAAFLALLDWAVQRFPDHSLFALNSGGHEYRFGGTHPALDLAPPPQATTLWTHIGANRFCCRQPIRSVC